MILQDYEFVIKAAWRDVSVNIILKSSDIPWVVVRIFFLMAKSLICKKSGNVEGSGR